MRRGVTTGMRAAGKSALGPLAAALLDTPKRGLWLDTIAMTIRQSVEAILAEDMAGSRY